MAKAIPFKMYMLKTKNYNAVHRMKRVVKGKHWWWDVYMNEPQYGSCRWIG